MMAARAISLKEPGTPSLQRSEGAARLCIVRKDGASRIKDLYQQGCAKLRLPSRHGSQTLEAVMINTSGGMTGGDRIEWVFRAGQDTASTLTTQASEKIYKSSSGHAEVAISISIGRNARFAWLPQETIMFNGSDLRRRIEVDLPPDAEALFVEPIVFGRTAMGEVLGSGMDSASLNDQWRFHRDGRIFHAEAFAISGRISKLMQQHAVTGSLTAIATVLFVSPQAETYLERARQLIGPRGGVSAWQGKLLARIMAPNGYELRNTLRPIINFLNPCPPCPKTWVR